MTDSTSRCAACGHQNDPGARFCADCGTRLRADDAPSPAVASDPRAWPDALPSASAGGTATATATTASQPATGIQLPVAQRVVRLDPTTGAPLTAANPTPVAVAPDPGWLHAATPGSTFRKAIVAGLIGIALLFLNRRDPTGSAGIFAMWAWYVGALYLIASIVRALFAR